MRAILHTLLVATLLLIASQAFAERTDEIVLWNGDTITGEVKSLQQGKLKFKTDNAGTIYFEWEFIDSVSSTSHFEVETQLGVHHYGMLAPGPEAKKLTVLGPAESVVLDMARVITIMPIKQTFWGRVDGSLNVGASFTSADSILQYSVESDATYRVRKFSAKLALSIIETRQDERDTTFKDSLDFTYTRYRKNRYFGSGMVGVDRSSELGIDFRAEIGGVYGRSFIQSNRTRLAGAAGLVVSRERPIGEEPSGTVFSALIRGQYHFFLYNYPKTDIYIDLGLLPSISEWPRTRVEFNASLMREIITDFTVNFSIYDSYDSDPPGEAAVANHDFGVILSIGYTV
jgi:hypothetical protein